jgi:FkbM family methyltransferase
VNSSHGTPVIKRYSQQLLKRLHIYERLKASHLYDLYWKIADPSVVDARNREIAFYRNTLAGFRKGLVIFDIGANDGYKTMIFLRLGAKVVAVDPDEANVRILSEKFCRCRLFKTPVSIVGKAVSDHQGTAVFWIDRPGRTQNTLSQKWVEVLRDDQSRFKFHHTFGGKTEVATVTLQELISAYGVPFFVKIDIEGYELNALKGLQTPVPYLSFELNLPEFSLEGLECISVLEQLAPRGSFNYVIGGRTELAMEQWVRADEFRDILRNCTHRAIEVFWQNQIAITTASMTASPDTCVQG